jgi:coenzyme F420-reducing hydrogenase gamma subunit
MNAKKKARIAFFDFSSCEGDQVELTNLSAPIFVGLLDHVEFVEFREVMKEKTTEPIDIAFIEGSFTRESDRARLEEIRKRASIVIAYGACAATGGINAMKNHTTDYKEFVYGKDASMPHLDSQTAQPISAAIKVDYALHGCPIDRVEFVHVVSHLLHGKQPVIPNYPVCVECKMRETVCRYDLDDHCLGLVARAGCGAPCPADGIPCEACRGFWDDPNEDALEEVLQSKGGLTAERARDKSRMFTATMRRDAK